MTTMCKRKKTSKNVDDICNESPRRLSDGVLRRQKKTRPRKVNPTKKNTAISTKEVVELAGWMYMPLRPSIAESARDSMYFRNLNEMAAYVENEYLVNHSKMFVGTSVRGLLNEFLGVEDLRIVQILADNQDSGTYFPIDCGHCFKRYCTETWEGVRRKAMTKIN